MPRAKSKKTRSKKQASAVKVGISKKETSFLNKVQSDLENKNTLLNLVLGALIVIVAGVLIFNYFNRSKELGPSSTSLASPTTDVDVAKDSLPGNYTVKEGDTLFVIAQKYYDDGWQYTNIVEANKLTNENTIEIGQVLSIPKLKTTATTSSPSPPVAASPASTDSAIMVEPTPTLSPTVTVDPTLYGEKITGDTYTVQAGDWLSTIAARAYNGDIMAYTKLAQTNNIPNPDLIEVGQVIRIPR